MKFINKSQRLATIVLPSEILYSTILLDELQGTDTSSYDKVLHLSKLSQKQDLSGFLWKFAVGRDSSFIHLYEKPNLSCDTSFVIQGPLHEHTLFTVLYTAPYGSICLGIWEDDFPSIQAEVEARKIDNYYNKYFQIVSTLKGFMQVKTPYAVKLRADEYFVNFLPFLTKLKSLPYHKIMTSNIFFKKGNDWPYHISDHIMGGKTECLFNMFVLSMRNAQTNTLFRITPEVHLALSYLEQFGQVHPEDRDIRKILTFMYTFFEIYPIKYFEDYKMKGEVFLTKADGSKKGINDLEEMSDFQVIFQ
jgi:hypothetical protein